MTEKVNVTAVIDVADDKVWSAISAIGGLDRWFPIIATCEVQGKGVGATRICGLENGAKLLEKVEEIDDSARRFRYTIAESPLPVSNYHATVEIEKVASGKTSVSWTAQYEVDDGHRQEMKGMLSSAFTEGIKGLEKDLKSTT